MIQILDKIVQELQQNFLKTIHTITNAVECDWVTFYTLLTLITRTHSFPDCNEDLFILSKHPNFEHCNRLYTWLQNTDDIFKDIKYPNYYLEKSMGFSSEKLLGSKKLIQFLIQYCIYLVLNTIYDLAENARIKTSGEAFIKIYKQKKRDLDSTFSEGINILNGYNENGCYLAICGEAEDHSNCCSPGSRCIAFGYFYSLLHNTILLAARHGVISFAGLALLTLCTPLLVKEAALIAFGMIVPGTLFVRQTLVAPCIYRDHAFSTQSNSIIPSHIPITSDTAETRLVDEHTPLLGSTEGAAAAVVTRQPQATTQAVYFGVCAQCSTNTFIFLSGERHITNDGISIIDVNSSNPPICLACNPQDKRLLDLIKKAKSMLVNTTHPDYQNFYQKIMRLTAYCKYPTRRDAHMISLYRAYILQKELAQNQIASFFTTQRIEAVLFQVVVKSIYTHLGKVHLKNTKITRTKRVY